MANFINALQQRLPQNPEQIVRDKFSEFLRNNLPGFADYKPQMDIKQGVKDLPANVGLVAKQIPKTLSSTLSAAAPFETALAAKIQGISPVEAVQQGTDLSSALESRGVPSGVAMPVGLAAGLVIPGAGELQTGKKAIGKLAKGADNLFQEAKKYKSVEEFVGKQVAISKDGSELMDLEGNFIPKNSDGTITLYHATGNAEQIKQQGFNQGREGGNVFFSTKPSRTFEATTNPTSQIVEIKIDPKYVSLDDAFRDGAIDVSGSYKDINKYGKVVGEYIQDSASKIPLNIKTKSQLTDIWKQANQ